MVKQYIRSCTVCAHSKANRYHPYCFLKQLPIPPQPWESISMDFIEQLLASEGHTAILGIVDRCRRDKNSVSSPPLEPCFDVPNNSPNHLLNSLLLCLEKLAKKSSNQTTHLFSCQNSL